MRKFKAPGTAGQRCLREQSGALEALGPAVMKRKRPLLSITGLKHKAQCELDIPVVIDRRGDGSKLRRVERPVWNLELRMVGAVECLKPELQLALGFGAPGAILEHRDIEGYLARCCGEVSRCVAA